MAYVSATDKNQVQYDVLTIKLDSTTNPKLIYKKSPLTNKGLDPSLFSGNNTKIVNILNNFANSIDLATKTVKEVYNTYNPVILDTVTAIFSNILKTIATTKNAIIS